MIELEKFLLDKVLWTMGCTPDGFYFFVFLAIGMFFRLLTKRVKSLLKSIDI